MARTPELNIQWKVNFAGNVNDEPREGEPPAVREARRDLEFNTRLLGIITQEAAVARQNGEPPVAISANLFERLVQEHAPDLTTADIAEINRRIERENLSPSAIRDMVMRRQADRQGERSPNVNPKLHELRPLFDVVGSGSWWEFINRVRGAARGPGPHVTTMISPEPGVLVYLRLAADVICDTPLEDRRVFLYTREEDEDGNFREVRWDYQRPHVSAEQARGVLDVFDGGPMFRQPLPPPPAALTEAAMNEAFGILENSVEFVTPDDPVQPSEPEDVEARPARRMRR